LEARSRKLRRARSASRSAPYTLRPIQRHQRTVLTRPIHPLPPSPPVRSFFLSGHLRSPKRKRSLHGLQIQRLCSEILRNCRLCPPGVDNTAGDVRACSHYWGGWRCERKLGQTKPSPQAVAGPPSRARMKYGPISRRNPSGRGQCSRFLRRSSLADTRYASLLTPRTRKNWLPAPPPQ